MALQTVADTPSSAARTVPVTDAASSEPPGQHGLVGYVSGKVDEASGPTIAVGVVGILLLLGSICAMVLKCLSSSRSKQEDRGAGRARRRWRRSKKITSPSR